jgi:hypothetical protein
VKRSAARIGDKEGMLGNAAAAMLQIPRTTQLCKSLLHMTIHNSPFKPSTHLRQVVRRLRGRVSCARILLGGQLVLRYRTDFWAAILLDG